MPVAAGAAPTERAPNGAGAPSRYVDPCEHTPQAADGADVDLRDLVVDDLFTRDRRTTDTSEPVGFRLGLCRPASSATAPTLRVDLHPRIDDVEGPDTDYAEDPSRWLLFVPPDTPGGGWIWQLHRRTGGGSQLMDAGPVTTQGTPDAVTSLLAEVPAAQVRAAGDPDTSSASGFPPLALRACSTSGDCGPGYRLGSDGRNTRTPSDGRGDVDYLPEPSHLPVTYPSVCQQGPVPSQDQRAPARATHAPARVVVDAGTAATLRRHGWTPIRDLPDGRTVFRGTRSSVRDLVPSASVDHVALRRPSLQPSDPYFTADGPGGATGQWSLRRAGAEQAWDHSRGSEDVLVAVLDSGFDGRHPDLRGRAVAGRDYVPTRGDELSRPLDVGTDTDLGGHGSFIASLAGARTDDGDGMAGLGWATRVLVARVFDAEGCASDPAIADAMGWAVDQGAAAINLSLGGPDSSPVLRDAGVAAAAAGAVPVAAAGNTSGGVPDYPAYYDAYVSVTATGYAPPGSDEQDPVASYSSYNDGVDIAAPGGSGDGNDDHDVLGACWQDASAVRGYCRLAGTSFATPLVAATVALARAEDPGRTVAGIRDLLADTALDLTACDRCRPGRDEASGSGRLRTGLALSRLASRSEVLSRIGASADPIGGSVAASQATFAVGGASQALLSRDDVFADALAGAPLAGTSGPILLTPTSGLDDRTAAELVRVLPRGATVTLLGGPVALSEQVEADVRSLGFTPARVWGPSRIETAVEIANRVTGGRASQVLVASAANWPDAVAGGAYAAAHRVPLLLTWPDDAGPQRSPRFLDTLASYGASDVVILGGPVAIADRTASQIEGRVPGTTRRVYGQTRNETAARIVTEVWGRTGRTEADHYGFVDGWRSDGWAYGLSASPYAARTLAPLLLVRPGLTFTEPTALLRERLRYRLPVPADGTFFGPITADAPTTEYTLARLGELLGG